MTLADSKRLTIGIDPGRKTGLAIAENGKLRLVSTHFIHDAMDVVAQIMAYRDYSVILVVIEDARLRGCAYNSQARAQGAGSVKRDCIIWQDWFGQYEDDERLCVSFARPGSTPTKLDKDKFKKITGWTGSTSEHARDAAMLIWGL